jgi:hypothetical protein
LPEQLRYLQAQVDAFVAGCVVDEGGDPAQIPTRRRALLDYRARIHRRVLQIDRALEMNGIYERGGRKRRLRDTWLRRFESLISTAVRIDQVLGLERKAKDVSNMSAAEYSATIDGHAHERRAPEPEPQHDTAIDPITESDTE